MVHNQQINKINESGFRPPLCTYRLNWARRTSWGWWDDWDDTVLQTQDSKFEPWRSEAEHATSRSRRLPAILTFTRGWGRNIFCFFENAETGNRTPNSGVKGSGANHYPRAPALSQSTSIQTCTACTCTILWIHISLRYGGCRYIARKRLSCDFMINAFFPQAGTTRSYPIHRLVLNRLPQHYHKSTALIERLGGSLPRTSIYAVRYTVNHVPYYGTINLIYHGWMNWHSTKRMSYHS